MSGSLPGSISSLVVRQTYICMLNVPSTCSGGSSFLRIQGHLEYSWVQVSLLRLQLSLDHLSAICANNIAQGGDLGKSKLAFFDVKCNTSL